MGVTTFETASAMWTCEPFIDEDGSVHMRLGLHGDNGDYAAVTITADDVVRSSRFFLDIGARVDEDRLIADGLVEMGRMSLHERDELLRERCRALCSRLAVSLLPAFPG